MTCKTDGRTLKKIRRKNRQPIKRNPNALSFNIKGSKLDKKCMAKITNLFSVFVLSVEIRNPLHFTLIKKCLHDDFLVRMSRDIFWDLIPLNFRDRIDSKYQ